LSAPEAGGDQRVAVATQPLDEAAFAPYGTVLGLPCPQHESATACRLPGTDFWHAHHFRAGEGGSPELLWVEYRPQGLRLQTLEAHWLTEQALVPLGGPAGGQVVQVVCPTRDDGSRQPDLARLRAFRIPPGRGLCMRPGCWHTTVVIGGPVTCLMLTRASTTLDLVAHLQHGAAASESSLVALSSLDPRAWVLSV
jgi:ureidoglycolate lyase